MSWRVAGDIAERLRDLAAALKITHAEMARRAGVSPNQVSMWVTKKQRPPRSRLQQWAQREGWPVSIFEENGPMPNIVVRTMPGRRASDWDLAEHEIEGYRLRGELMHPSQVLAIFLKLRRAEESRRPPEDRASGGEGPLPRRSLP